MDCSRAKRALLLVTALGTAAGLVLLPGLATVAGPASAAGSAAPAAPTTLFEESFAGGEAPGFVALDPVVTPYNNPAEPPLVACLTGASSVPAADGGPLAGCDTRSVAQRDPDGQGVLRLTNEKQTQSGGVVREAPVATSAGLDITFDSYQWLSRRSSDFGGDGLALVLTVADPAAGSSDVPQGPGGSGTGLGYLPEPGYAPDPGNPDDPGVPDIPGLRRTWLAFALDVYGNHGNPEFGGCPSGGGGFALRPSSLTVRGPGDGQSGYCLRDRTALAQDGRSALSDVIDRPLRDRDRDRDPSVSVTRPDSVPVEVAINPSAKPVTTASGLPVPARSWLAAVTTYEIGPDGARLQQVRTGPLPNPEEMRAAGIPDSLYDSALGLPGDVRVGWTAGTGALTEIHEIANAEVTTLSDALPTVDTMVAAPTGTDLRALPARSTTALTVSSALAPESGPTSDPVTTTVELPAGLTPGTVARGGAATQDCATTGQTVTCTYTPPTTLAAGARLPDVTIPVTTGDADSDLRVVTTATVEGSTASTVRTAVSIVRRAQSIDFTLPSGAPVGTSVPLTATGGGSTQPVTFTAGPSDVCAVRDDRLQLLARGDCVVTANQAGDGAFTAAPPVTRTLQVGRIATSTTLRLTSASATYGAPVQGVATVPAGVPGVVRFVVDKYAVGEPVRASRGTATSEPLTSVDGSVLSVGRHEVTAVFVPDQSETYARSSATPQTLTIGQAATTTAVTVADGRPVATVASTNPRGGPPTGEVTFTVRGREIGSADLVDGVATLPRTVSSAQRTTLAAAYAGDASFLASSGSLGERSTPRILAQPSSRRPISRSGWYRTPVWVNFVCSGVDSPVVSCSDPAVLSDEGAGQSASGTVTAADGGTATATASGIDIDLTSPRVRIVGPRHRCVATDRLSGVASCVVERRAKRDRVVFVAKARDEAGNRASVRRVVRR